MSLVCYSSERYVLPLPPGHRFPMAKYRLLRQRALAAGLPLELREAPAASYTELCLAHEADYVRRVFQGELDAAAQRAIGLPWSPAMVERSRRSSGATLAACRTAQHLGIAANLAGGTHHAHADRGAGFCVFNDAAVAIRVMQAEGQVRRVLVVDCDVHQGDGTASIFAADDDVFTLSLHGANNFPFAKARSSLDVELADGTTDADYLAHLDSGLQQALVAFAPELAIYLAGADVLHGDRYGRLALSLEGMAARDHRVLVALRGRGIPVAITMAGGYGIDLEHTVAGHVGTLRCACAAAAEYAARRPTDSTRSPACAPPLVA